MKIARQKKPNRRQHTTTINPIIVVTSNKLSHSFGRKLLFRNYFMHEWQASSKHIIYEWLSVCVCVALHHSSASDNSNTVDVVSKVAIICILTCQHTMWSHLAVCLFIFFFRISSWIPLAWFFHFISLQYKAVLCVCCSSASNLHSWQVWYILV